MAQTSSASAPARRAMLVGYRRGGPGTLLPRLARELGRAGVQVVAVRDAQAALEGLAKSQVDLVLCDVPLPGSAALDLLRAIRERDARVPVILLREAREGHPSPLEAAAQRAYYLEKPVRVESLLPVVLGQLGWAGLPPPGRAQSTVDPDTNRALEGGQVSATAAKNEFGRVLDLALRRGRVVITKHNAPKAVLLSADAYEALAARASPDLDALRGEFETMLARLQKAPARAAAEALFAASSSELGEAAIAAARGRKRAARRG